jgi:hypothetical protein
VPGLAGLPGPVGHRDVGEPGRGADPAQQDLHTVRPQDLGAVQQGEGTRIGAQHELEQLRRVHRKTSSVVVTTEQRVAA